MPAPAPLERISAEMSRLGRSVVDPFSAKIRIRLGKHPCIHYRSDQYLIQPFRDLTSEIRVLPVQILSL